MQTNRNTFRTFLQEHQDRARERETSIVFSDADHAMRIYSAQPAMLARLRKHPLARLTERFVDGERVTGEEYELPVACLAILLRPRSSAWGGMVRTGRGGGKPRPAGARGRRDGLSPSERGKVALVAAIAGD